jgi:putative phosphoesterase
VKLGIISDTHVRTIDEIPAAIRNALADVDIIIHAGDFTQKAVLDGLRSIGKVKAVCGNIDSIELKRSLPERDVFEASGKKIGLIHGSGAPWNRYIRGVLLVNPGQAKNSFGLLTIDDKIRADILRT